MAFYSGITGGRFVLSSLNLDEFGLEHTGQIGDVVVGSFASTQSRRPPAAGAGAFGKAHIYPPHPLGDDEELFFMNTRGFRGAMSSHLTRQHYTFAVSPFADVDVLEFMFSLPLEWRVGHKLFSMWIEKHYPWALDVPTTRLLPFRVHPVRHTSLFTKKAVGVVSRRVQNHMNRHDVRGARVLSRMANSMNPLETWYARNPEFRTLVEESRRTASRMGTSHEVTAALGRSFDPGSSIWDKVLAVTVVSMHSMYFSGAEV